LFTTVPYNPRKKALANYFLNYFTFIVAISKISITFDYRKELTTIIKNKIMTTSNWNTKEAKIARNERNLKNKEYALNLAKPFENDAVNPYYYSSALYDYKMAKQDLEYSKN